MMFFNKERFAWLTVIFAVIIATILLTKSAITSKATLAIESPASPTTKSSHPPVFVAATSTSTPIPCIASSHAPKAGLGQQANEWFQSTKPEIPNRDQYNPWDDWETICSIYRTAVSNDEDWVHNPISIAIMTTSLVNSDNFLPDRVIAIAKPEHNIVTIQNVSNEVPAEHNVLTVVFSVSHLLTQEAEIRVDLIREDEIWQIVWIGSRGKCKSSDENWAKIPCQ